ncbi:MAG: peptidoglycan DD-metalloendopeptidase family protein [Anaerolineales bacterium]|nr:peptidoglycan DD-metalloendopeptidase family protein [Anaerolineales bacterium]
MIQVQMGIKFQLCKLIRISITVIGLPLLSACALNFGSSSTDQAALPPTVHVPSASFTPSDPTETQVSLNLTTLTPIIEPAISSTPEPIPPTPDFSVPLDPQKSFAAWRPPVYPVPWIPSPQDHFYFTNPIAAYDIESAYSTYGYGDVFFGNVVHTGIDIPGDMGTPILAAGDGKIIYAGYGIYRGGDEVYDDPYGKAVVIEHSFAYKGEPLYTLYAHLDEIHVEEGQVVTAGHQIGSMGKTGKTTGPHLHFEVRVGENEYFSTRNPDLWISPPQGWGILVGQILTWEGRSLEQQPVYLHPLGETDTQDESSDRLWIGKSYQNQAINSDPYYLENLSIANIPAGTYLVSIPVTYIGFAYQEVVEIRPGQVTYIKFNLWRGFTDYTPPTQEVFFSPSP